MARDAKAVKRFFRKALRAGHTVAPRIINVDRNPAYPKAVGKLKRKGTLPPDCELRPVKYLNNLVEQDHRFIKRRVKPGLGYERSELVVRHRVAHTSRVREGNEAIHQLRKGQVQGTTKGDIKSQIHFVSTAFRVVA